MTRTPVLSMLFACTWRACLGVICLALTAEAEAKDPLPRNSMGFISEAGRRYSDIQMPLAISEEDLDRWARLLRLSDAQLQAFRNLYDETYVPEEAAAHMAYVQPIWDAVADLAQNGPISRHPYIADEYYKLLSTDRSAALKKLRALEDGFLDEMLPLLSEEQLSIMPLVYNDRKRSSFRRAPQIPGGATDLLRLLIAEPDRDWESIPIDPMAYRSATVDYDQRITVSLTQRAKAYLEMSVKGNVLLAEARYIDTHPRDHGSTVTSNELRRQIRSIRNRIRQSEEAVLRLNLEFIERLDQVLDAASTAAVEQSFLRSEFYPAFPDPSDIGDYAVTCRVAGGIDGDDRKELLDLMDYQEIERIRLNKRICTLFVDFRTKKLMEWRPLPEELDLYIQETKQLHQRRDRLTEEVMTRVEQLFGSAMPADLRRLGDQIRARMKSYQPEFDRRSGV